MQEHICIVTGAASGIGLAISELFVAQKFHVLMVDRQENELMKEAKRLECEYVVADLSQRSECKKIIDFAKAKFDYVDILVNVAGLQHVSSIETFDEDKWDYMLNVMLTAPFLLTKYVWPLMKEKAVRISGHGPERLSHPLFPHVLRAVSPAPYRSRGHTSSRTLPQALYRRTHRLARFRFPDSGCLPHRVLRCLPTSPSTDIFPRVDRP